MKKITVAIPATQHSRLRDPREKQALELELKLLLGRSTRILSIGNSASYQTPQEGATCSLAGG